MNNNKKQESNNQTTQTNILQQITTQLKNNTNNTFTQQIQQYGTINYTRTQYLPQLSKTITENPKHQNKLLNYTTLESMLLDILPIIEQNTIQKIENNTQKPNNKKLTQFTIQLLKQLQKTLTTTQQTQNTQEILKTQTQFYKLIYNEKIEPRIK